MPGLIQKAGFADAYDARIKRHVRDSFGTAEPEFKRFYRDENITTQDIRASSQSGFGRWAETGESKSNNIDGIYEGYDYTCTPYKYTSGFIISEEAQADDLSGLLGQNLATAFAESWKDTEEYLMALPFNLATSTSGFSPWKSGGDGVSLLSVSHPILSGGVYANCPLTTATLSIAALEAAQTRMALCQNARGFVRPFEGVTLIVPTADKWLALKITGSAQQLPFTSDYTKNPVVSGMTVETWSHLTSGFFLQAKKAGSLGQKGHLITQVYRARPTFNRDNVHETGDRKYRGMTRVGAIDWSWRGTDGSV